jgi:hypothetical protein
MAAGFWRVGELFPLGVGHLVASGPAEGEVAAALDELGRNQLPACDVTGLLAAGAPESGYGRGEAGCPPMRRLRRH